MEAFFPRRLNLTLRTGNACTTLHFKAGLQELPDSLATHWWLRVNGVKLVVPTQQKLAPVPAPQPQAKFKYLDSLADQIAKMGFEIEAEAQAMIDNDLGDLRVQKAKVFEQLRRALNDRRDAVRALAVKLELTSGTLEGKCRAAAIGHEAHTCAAENQHCPS